MRLPLNATTIAWHPDSTVLAAAGWSGMLSVWNAKKGKLIRDLGLPDRARAAEIQFSKDGKYLAIGKAGVDKYRAYLKILDAASLQAVDEFSPPIMKTWQMPSLASLSIDPVSSRRIALASYVEGHDPVIYSIGDPAKNPVRAAPASRGSVQKVIFSPNGKTVAVGRFDGRIDFFEADSGELKDSFAAFEKIWCIEAMAMSPDGTAVFAASNTGGRHEWVDRNTRAWMARRNNEPIKMWDVGSLKLIRQFDTSNESIASLDVSADGRLLVAGLSGGYVDIWEIDTGIRLMRFRPAQHATLAKLSPDGTLLATCDTGAREIRIWSVDYE